MNKQETKETKHEQGNHKTVNAVDPQTQTQINNKKHQGQIPMKRTLGSRYKRHDKSRHTQVGNGSRNSPAAIILS